MANIVHSSAKNVALASRICLRRRAIDSFRAYNEHH
jgi:hypothetical protein